MSAECDKKFILQYFHIINIGFIFQVFLTGQQAFPDDMGGGVYFSWPSADGSGSCPWQYLGMICNKKPSAIFKVGKFKAQEIDESNLSARFGQQMLQSQQPVAQVGISVEPITVLQGLQQASMESEAAMVPKFVEFTQKMVQSLFNYTTSASLIIDVILNTICFISTFYVLLGFAVDANETRMRSSETYIPYSAVQQWCSNFERKLKIDPYFWTKS